MTDHLTIVDHPLVQHKLTLMRDKTTPTAVFRQLLREISQLLAYEVTRGLPMTVKHIETPLTAMDAPVLDGRKTGTGVDPARGQWPAGRDPGVDPIGACGFRRALPR